MYCGGNGDDGCDGGGGGGGVWRLIGNDDECIECMYCIVGYISSKKYKEMDILKMYICTYRYKIKYMRAPLCFGCARFHMSVHVFNMYVYVCVLVVCGGTAALYISLCYSL